MKICAERARGQKENEQNRDYVVHFSRRRICVRVYKQVLFIVKYIVVYMIATPWDFCAILNIHTRRLEETFIFSL